MLKMEDNFNIYVNDNTTQQIPLGGKVITEWSLSYCISAGEATLLFFIDPSTLLSHFILI